MRIFTLSFDLRPLKKFIAIAAFAGILLQTFNQVIILAQYYANKDYIAKNLCENRNNPKMHCDGKCCLKKRLAKECKDQAPSPDNQKSEQVTLFCSYSRFVLAPPIVISVSSHYFNRNDLRTFSFPHTVFRPPTV